jgi:hypothetical protein
MKFFVSLLLVCLWVADATADMESLDAKNELSPHTWDALRERMSLLNNISYLPSLLPTIMKNRHALGLSKEQVAAFRDWRRKNYQKMVDAMNIIVEKRIELSQRAVRPDVTPSDLNAMQEAIFDLQREVFSIRLSCRELVIGTFTEEQWSNFAFIATDDPQLSGLFAY